MRGACDACCNDTHIAVRVREQLTYERVSCRVLHDAPSLTLMARFAAISALVTRQLSSLFRYRKLYEYVFESYIFSGGASSYAAELAKPPMPVTV